MYPNTYKIAHYIANRPVYVQLEDAFPICIDYTYENNQVKTVTYWTDSNRDKKLKEESFSYENGLIKKNIVTHYDSEGIVFKTVEETYIYDSNNKLVSLERKII